MAKFQSKASALAPYEEAPDPVEFARQQTQGDAPPDIGDPQGIPAVSGHDPSMAQALVMIAEALKTIKAGDAGAAQRLAGIEQFLLRQEETRPHENLFNPPMISAFNPLGERDHPRPDLQCRIIWVGYELSKENSSRHEIELLNRLQPGVFRVTKADGRVIRMTVAEKLDDGGRREMLTVHFPCKGSEDRQSHAPMTSYLLEAFGETVSPTAMHAEIAALKAQLAAARSATGMV